MPSEFLSDILSFCVSSEIFHFFIFWTFLRVIERQFLELVEKKLVVELNHLKLILVSQKGLG